jgi:hypothetical protein
MKSFGIIISFIIFSILSCTQSYVKSIYPIPSKKLSKKKSYYTDKYGYISMLADTTFNDGQLCRIFRRGILQKIGPLHDKNPVGYWFIFKDSLELEYIIKHDTNKTDSFYHPFSIVHQRW